MTLSTMAARASAAGNSVSTVTLSGRENPGRYRSLTRVARILSARSFSYTHSRMRGKRGASTTASAVPQLPAPTMARSFTGGSRSLAAPEGEDRLGSGAQPRDVLAVAVDDQRPAQDSGRDDDARWMRDQPHGQRESPRADDGAERDMPGPGNHHHEDHQCGGQRQRRGAEPGANERGHGLTAAEAQEHRGRLSDHKRSEE